MAAARRAALGKGLSALLSAPAVRWTDESPAVPEVPPAPAPAAPAPAALLPTQVVSISADERAVIYVEVGSIAPNPMQPRHRFSPESLQELANSIQNHGVLQPVLVTIRKSGGGYILVAGERRLKAATIAGLKRIPAIVADVSEEEMLEIAIVENVQRDDLNAVEEARAYRQLIDTFGWTQEQVSQRVGKNRTTVTNSLRLLRLDEDILSDLETEKLTAGHARAILSLDDNFFRRRLRQEILDRGLSVRESERRSLQYQKSAPPTRKAVLRERAEKASENLDIVALQERLMGHLGCRVRIKSADARSGVVEIPFQSPEELDRFLQAVNLPE